MEKSKIRLRLRNDSFARDVEIALLENEFTLRRVHNEGEACIDIIFWGGTYFIETKNQGEGMMDNSEQYIA